MKKIFVFLLVLFCGIFYINASSVYSFGTNYIFFNEYSTFQNVKTSAFMNSLGLDFSYRFFNDSDDYLSDFDINADDGSLIETKRHNFSTGFWYSFNLNFPLVAKITMGESFINLNHKQTGFWALILDNICGVTFSLNITNDFYVDLSVGPKIGFFYLDYEETTNLTFGLALEVGGIYYFENAMNTTVPMGIRFGSKLSYDFYSIAQAYYPQDYSSYGIFSVAPFISFVLKN